MHPNLTNFSAAGADNGDLFIVSGDNVAYAIATVDSDLQITLAANYAGVTNATAAYAITVDFTPNFGLPLPQTGDIGVSALLRDGFTEIDTQLLNTVGVTTLDGLTDTDLTGLNADDILVYNNVTSKWEPASQSTGSGLFNVVEDTSPSLGGTLDVNGNSIVSTSNGNIIVNPNGTGRIILDGNEMPGTTGTNGQLLTTNGAGVASWGSVSFAGVKEEFRGQGFETLGLMSVMKSGRESGMQIMDSHHELEQNIKVRKVMERFGGKLAKRFRIYKKPINN